MKTPVQTYPRCKFHIDGRVMSVKDKATDEAMGPEWFNHPDEVPPSKPKPAEGCANCLALLAEHEADKLKFDQAWAEKIEAHSKVVEENAELRAKLAAKTKGK